MKEFKSKGISLENMVGADPMKEKKTAGTPGKAYNQTIVLTEDLVWGRIRWYMMYPIKVIHIRC